MALIINIPLFIVGLFILGKKFIVGTLLGTIASSVLIDVFAFVPAVETEPILAALYGGLCNGAGLGVVFFFGGTTGGVDIVASLIKKPPLDGENGTDNTDNGRVLWCCVLQ